MELMSNSFYKLEEIRKNLIEKGYDSYLKNLFIFLKTFEVMGNVNADPSFFKVLKMINILILLFALFLTNFTTKALIISTIILALMFVSYRNSKDGALVWTFLIITACASLKKESFFRSFLLGTLTKNSMTFILSFFGIYTPFIERKPGTEIMRYSFGFAHANTLHLLFFISVVTFLLIIKKDQKISKLINIMTINFCLYHFTKSRTAMLMVTVLLIGTLIYDLFSYTINRDRICKYMFWVLFSMLVISIGLVILASINYTQLKDISFISSLNRSLSGRLEQAHWYFNNYGMSMFGKYIPEIMESPRPGVFVLDIGYMRTLIQFGVVPFTIFLILQIKVIHTLYIEHRYYECFVILCSGFYWLIEHYYYYILFNPLLIYFGDQIFYSKNLSQRSIKVLNNQ
ncbi:hypothetical protein PT201_02175 [Erysipelothrix rhusiopathiae]|uniref:O-antigen ligase domain-containing protein n=1 Tax=Erysipelothrix rhusiopathiae TaxID=1648 RepID=A0A6S6I7D1_ERYRH|nr:hypothetical protein [Erysipelothrix rhusiopathiae]BCB22709.1 hypothetical protein [Erysipelothrix rhusiopathiae]